MTELKEKYKKFEHKLENLSLTKKIIFIICIFLIIIVCATGIYLELERVELENNKTVSDKNLTEYQKWQRKNFTNSYENSTLTQNQS